MKPKRTVPPSGAPLYMKDLFSGILGIFRPTKALRRFEDELRIYFGVKHVFLVSSGKAALTLILQSLSEITGRKEVVIPSYTCFSVPSAIVKTGLKPIICDVAENDINYDTDHLQEVVGESTLCVIATHLFGIPCNLEPVLSVTRSAGNYVVEDCAQAMGAELNGQKAGTIGDVGFFSLGRGKNLCAVSGGIIVTNNDTLAKILGKQYSRLKTPALTTQLISLCVAIFLYVFSRPSLYWFPASLPFLKIGQTIYSTKFSIEKLAGFNAGLAANWKWKLESFNKARRERADIYKGKIKDNGLVLIKEPAKSLPVYLRFPLITSSPAERNMTCERLASAGLGASPGYPTGIAEIPELDLTAEKKARCQMGNKLAKRIVTLPTHPQAEAGEINRMGAMILERERSVGQEFRELDIP